MTLTPRILLSALLAAASVSGVASAQTAVAPQVAPASVSKAMDAYLKTLFKPDQPGAVVLVMRHGKPLFQRAYGLASVELKAPMRADTVFGIASVGKQFTAAAVLKLAEQGKIDLQAPVTRYLAQAPAAWGKISIAHLLTNTSGIGNLFEDAAFRARVREDLSPEQLLAVAASKPLLAEPGTRFMYASINYNLLGMVVQQQSGKAFDAYIDEQFLKPLGMRHTFGPSYTGVVPGLATAYAEGPAPVPYFSPSTGFAAGGHYSNLADLAIWTRALYSGKVVSEANLRVMTSANHLLDGTDTHYGYGTRPHTLNGQPYIQSNGDIPGFHAETVYLPKSDLYVAILTNGEDLPVGLDPIGKRLVQMALGQPVTALKPIALSAEQRAAVIGKYALDGRERIIRLEKGQLVSDVPGNPPSPLAALSATELYFVENPDARLSFAMRDGKAVSVTRYNLERMPMPAFPRKD